MKKTISLFKKLIPAVIFVCILGSASAQVIDNNGTVTNIVSGTVVTGSTLNNTNSGTFTNNGTLTLSADLNNNTSASINGDGTYNIGGTWTNDATFAGGSGTVNFDGATQTIGGSNSTTFNNLNISSSTSTTLGLNTSVAGNLSVSSPATFDLVTYTCNRTASGGTLSVSSGATLKIGGTNTLPSNYAAHTFGTTSTTNYYGTTQTVAVLTGSEKYGNLVISGSSTKTVAGAVGAAGNLTIESGTYLSINSTASLTVAGSTAINQSLGLKIKSSASGNGAFIDNGLSGSGSEEVELYLTHCVDGGTDFNCWHYITPPVSAAVAGVFYQEYMKYYNEPTGAWSNYMTSNATPLNVTQGYAVSVHSDGIKTFTGQLNTGDKTTPSLTRGTGYGWNLVGNPFPSPIDINMVQFHDVDAVVYYLDQSAGNYKAYPQYLSYAIGTRYPLSMQGFFVHVPSGASNTTITFPNAARTTATDAYTEFYKNSVADLLRLKAEGTTGMNDEIIICFRPDAIPDYEKNLDCTKLFGGLKAPQMYSVTPGGSKLSINSLPFAGINTVVPLEFSVETNGTGNYSITASELESFRAGTTITLEDKKTNTSQELTANPVYNFSYTTGDDPARFLLHFYNPSFGITESEKQNDMQIYSYGNEIYVKDLTGNPVQGELFIYNMIGQEITHQTLTDNSMNKYTLNLPGAYYIVRVITKNKTYNGKVYLD